MEQFASSVNEFLTFRRYQILPDKGKVSALQANQRLKMNMTYSIRLRRLTPISIWKGLDKLMDETPHPEHDHPARIPKAIEELNT